MAGVAAGACRDAPEHRGMNRADLLRNASAVAGVLAAGEGAGAAAAGAAAAPGASARTAGDVALDRFLADEWAAYHRRHPEAASLDGDRGADDRWDDASAEAAAAEAAHQRTALAALERFDPARLSDTGRLNRDLYAESLRDAVRGFELRTYLFAVNQRGGVQTDVAIVDNLPFATLRDYERWALRSSAGPRRSTRRSACCAKRSRAACCGRAS